MGPTMEWELRSPAGPLRGLVDRYVGYRMAGFSPVTHRGLPSRHMTFIVSIGAPIDVRAQTNAAQEPGTYRCVLSGLQASSAQIAHDGSQEGVAIQLTPLGSQALLGMPAAVLWDLSLEASEVMGPAGDELWERLQAAPGWYQRFSVCDEVLLRRLGDRSVTDELSRAWRGMVGSGGRLRVDWLASQTGHSRQHFTKLFRTEFGLGPKLASRIVRFERTQRLLRASPTVSRADIAAASGYADQAHMTREFAALAGCTPSALITEDLPFVQDSEDSGA